MSEPGGQEVPLPKPEEGTEQDRVDSHMDRAREVASRMSEPRRPVDNLQKIPGSLIDAPSQPGNEGLYETPLRSMFTTDLPINEGGLRQMREFSNNQEGRFDVDAVLDVLNRVQVEADERSGVTPIAKEDLDRLLSDKDGKPFAKDSLRAVASFIRNFREGVGGNPPTNEKGALPSEPSEKPKE